MELSKWLQALTLAVLASMASAQGVRIVDPTGTRNFDTLQQAVDASYGGELLLVGAGDYAGFTIDAKSVDIVVKPGALAVVRGQVTIKNLGAQNVLLSGLEIRPPSPSAGPITPGLHVDNCAGHVRLQQCTIYGANGETWLSVSGKSALVANAADQLVLIDCTLNGGAGGSGVSFTCGPSYVAGGAGLEAHVSRVAIYQTQMRGGYGGDIFEGFGGDGGSGANLQNSIVFASASTFVGGSGGYAGTDGTCWGLLGGNGGHGLAIGPGADMTGLANHHLGAPGGGGSSPGLNGSPGMPIANSGVYTQLPGQGRTLRGPRYAADGATIGLTLTGASGDRVHLVRGLTLDFTAALSLSGYWLIQGPFFLSRLGQGVIPPANVLNLPTKLPDLSGPIVQRRVAFQSLFKGATTSVLSGPWHIATIQSTPGPDCNGNGINDYLEALAGTITDCNKNLIADECELLANDCNSNGVPDECDLAGGTSPDVNQNGIPDECEVSTGVWHVDDSASPGGNGSLAMPFQTLRQAFDAALGNHTILVNDGLYSGPDNRDLDFLTRDLAVRSLHGATNCIIDCGGLSPAFRLQQGQTRASLIEGLTIRNSAASAVGWVADGIIKDCVIDMGTLGTGAGLYLQGSPLVMGCRLQGNAQSGGIHCWAAAVHIVDTSVEGFLAGGGINVDGPWGGQSMISHCRIVNNRLLYQGGQSGRGGGITARGQGSLLVEDCLIAGNRAFAGGGIYAERMLIVNNCTLVDNLADTGPAVELYRWASSPLGNRLIANSILWNNRAPSGVEQVRNHCASVELWLRWSDVQDGSAAVTTAGYALTQYGPFNIDEDPQFLDPDGPDNDPLTLGDNDYRLGGISGCLDSGAKHYVSPDLFDLDFDGDLNEPVPFGLDFLPRFVDLLSVPNTGQGTLPFLDMGCYEKQF